MPIESVPHPYIDKYYLLKGKPYMTFRKCAGKGQLSKHTLLQKKCT